MTENMMALEGSGRPETEEAPTQAVWREVLVAIGVALLLVCTMTALKEIHLEELRGDSAIFFQVAHNIAEKGAPLSGIAANVQDFIFQQHLPTMPAAEVAKNPLAPPAVQQVNMLHWHAYYILYAVAPLSKFIPVETLLLSIFAAIFIGLVVAAYFALRGYGIPVLGAVLFCIVLVSHPAWSESLMWGQFYPDRLFVLFGFLLMYAVSRGTAPRWLVLLLALACAATTERGPLIAGVSVLLYAGLYWKKPNNDRIFNLAIGCGLLLYGVVLLRYAIHNPYYSDYMPTSIQGIINEFTTYKYYPQKVGLFFLINSPLLILAAFEARAGLIAFAAMLPNVLGTIGGAEKNAWSSHYSSYYFPILVWAAMLGFAALYRKCSQGRRPQFFFGTIIACVVLWRCIDPYSFTALKLSISNVGNDFLLQIATQSQRYLNGDGFARLALGSEISNAVPRGSKVTSIEAGMPFVYDDRAVHFFPLGIDTDNYAIVAVTTLPDGTYKYTGAVTFLGAQEQQQLDDVLEKRLVRDHYDVKHPVIIPALGMAVLKRS